MREIFLGNKYPRGFDGNIQEIIYPTLQEEVINAEHAHVKDSNKMACSKECGKASLFQQSV